MMPSSVHKNIKQGCLAIISSQQQTRKPQHKKLTGFFSYMCMVRSAGGGGCKKKFCFFFTTYGTKIFHFNKIFRPGGIPSPHPPPPCTRMVLLLQQPHFLLPLSLRQQPPCLLQLVEFVLKTIKNSRPQRNHHFPLMYSVLDSCISC